MDHTATINQEVNEASRECPACDAKGTVGRKRVFGRFWFRRCSQCRYYESEPLPSITKRIIYIDQFALSDMVKAKQPRWADALARLRCLARLEVITCPFSSIHRDESLVAEGLRDDLKRLYRELSGGTRFLHPFEIEQNQLVGAMNRWLAESGADITWTKPRHWREFCYSDPHAWRTDLNINADFPFNRRVANLVLTEKERLHRSLLSVSQQWRAECPPFEDIARSEAIAYGKALLECYDELVQGPERIIADAPAALRPVLEHFLVPDRFDPGRPPGIQPGIRLVHHLMSMIQEARPDEHDLRGSVEQFFASDHAIDVPFNWIASRLWAVVAEHACNPKGPREIEDGDPNDITVISRYAPYCDAMIVDNYFRDAASKGKVAIARRYGVLLFSARTLPAFVEYLDGLLAEVTADHLNTLRTVYC